MIVWIAIRRHGLYRHDLLGVFPSLEAAEAVGLAAINAEPGHYHSVDICESVVADGQTEEHLRAWVVPTWGGRPVKADNINHKDRPFTGALAFRT